MKIQRAEDVELLLKTNKESESGIFSNQRLLMIKAGIISYFSQVSKKFTGNSKFLQNSGKFPKYTIKANEIDHIQLKGDVLSMLFKKQRLIGRNQFQDMVRRVEYEPERVSQISAKEEVSGYVKWTFQSDNIQSMQQFIRLTNLFRTNNPRFQPSLSSLLSSFRGEKQKKDRQMSMKQTASGKMTDLNKKRMSQVPSTGTQGRDLFLQSLGIVDKKQQQSLKKSKQIPIPSPLDEATARAQLAKSVQRKENLRINRRISHLTNINHPIMGIIQQKQNQDKASEMSRNFENAIVQKKLQVKPSTEEVQEIIIEQKKQEITVIIQQDKPFQDILLSNQHIPVSHTQEIVKDLDKPSTIQNIFLKTQQSIKVQQTQRQTEKQVIIQQKTKSNKHQFMNNSYQSEWQQQRQKKKKIIQQFFKATSFIDNFNPQQICQKLSIQMEQLQSLMKSHSKEEDSAWAFIQNNFAYHFAKNRHQKSHQQRLAINDEIITQYYVLGDEKRDENFQLLKTSLQNQISFIKPEKQNQEQHQAIHWMEEQMQDSLPRHFSSKIMSNSHFKIYIRPIQFKRQKIKHLKGGWIVNQKGHLQQFLAYLRLKKVVKQLSSIISNEIELICGDAMYLRCKEYQGIAKQWRIGYPRFPIRSIKTLEYITKSKQMKLFFRDFQQFNVVTEVLQQGYKYRLHLDRIQAQPSQNFENALMNQLKKLIFPFDNELDLFYSSNQYIKIEDLCLNLIQEVLIRKPRIQKQDLYTIMQKIQNNITVDTLCRLLGCRIDRFGNIFFHHTLLRLGGRQFGEQISLIKRSKKKGNNQLGKELSKRLMGKLYQYQYVTPISHFIEIYLQIIDFMVINENQLQRAVSILLKVLSHLGDCEVEQYPIYMSLMKTYLKLNQMDNFVKCLENCRLLISRMFKQYSLLLDYPLQRIVIMILLKEDTNRALNYSLKILKQIKQNNLFSENAKQRYCSKIQWDKDNILLERGQCFQAFNDCITLLKDIQNQNTFYPDYWIDGVICLTRCWLQIKEVNSINGAELQKRIGRAIQLAIQRENLEVGFILYCIGQKVLNKCQQLNLPKLLDCHDAFEQIRIQFNEAQSTIFYILSTNK